MDDKLSPEMRATNLARLREYLTTLPPNLQLSEPDSTALRHYALTGHVMRFGCCRDASKQTGTVSQSGACPGASATP